MRPEGADAGGAGLLRLRERLGLTADQVARIESIQTALREQNRPLIEQLRASGERPRGRDGIEANPLTRALRENARAARAQMQDVLTDAQQATLEEMRAERPRRGRPTSG